MIRVSVQGGAELARNLTALGTAISRPVSIAALGAGARLIRDEARRLAPRRPPLPDLADHIDLVVVPSEDSPSAHETRVGIGVPEEFFYDFFLEYGTTKMPARPFYRPALDAQGAAAIEAIQAHYWEALERVTV
jgi:HK97 gp10 family phage protein